MTKNRKRTQLTCLLAGHVRQTAQHSIVHTDAPLCRTASRSDVQIRGVNGARLSEGEGVVDMYVGETGSHMRERVCGSFERACVRSAALAG